MRKNEKKWDYSEFILLKSLTKKGFVSVFLLAYYLHSLKVKRFHDHYEQL